MFPRTVVLALYAGVMGLIIGGTIAGTILTPEPPRTHYYDRFDHSANTKSNKTLQQKSLWIPEDSTGFFALWTTVFTGVLALSTILLWNETSRNASIAQRALTELEAPYVALKVIDPGLRVEFSANGEPILLGSAGLLRAKFCFENSGRTPASLWEFRADLRTAKKGSLPDKIDPDGPTKNEQFGELVGPGRQSTPLIRRFRDFPGLDVKSIDSGDVTLFLIGFIKFTDIFRAKYTVGFCAKFDRMTGSCPLDGGEGYNYRTPKKFMA